MKLSALMTALVICVTTIHAYAATGTVAIVLKDGTDFRAEFSTASTANYVACHGERLVCDNAYRFWTSKGDVGAQGHTTIGLKVDPGPAANWQPYVGVRKLVQTSVDAESGAPCYDVALQVPPLSANEEISVNFKNEPTGNPALGVASIWTYTRGICKLCVSRRAYNATCLRLPGAHSFLLFMRKEFMKPCADGAFAVNEFEVVYTRETAASICHVFANPEGTFGNKPPRMGHVAASEFGAEFGSKPVTAGFSEGQSAGDRWLEMMQDLGNYFLLQPQGCKQWQHTAGWCWTLQCEELPPGDPPGECCCCPCRCCEEDPEPPGGGQAPCPKSQGYWKNHGSEWPLAAVILGDEAYTKAQALMLMNTPVAGDASLILARQLIAAKLNKANGAVVPPAIDTLINNADALLTPQAGKLPYSISSATPTGQQMVLTAGVLEKFNTGKLTDGCDEE